MYKKLKTVIIILLTFSLILTITLVLLSLARIQVGYIGLCYDNIISNYSSTQIYTPGLYFIGIARSFIRMRQIPTNVQLEVQTYTVDYYKLNAKIICSYQFVNSTDFVAISRFYTNMGESAGNLIKSVMEKKVISILSQYTSNEYQYDQLNLEQTIKNTLDVTFIQELQSSLNINVLIESIVISGVTSGQVQAVNRKIQDFERKLAKVQRQKIQLSKWMQNYQNKVENQIRKANEIVNARADVIEKIIDAYSVTGSRISEILLGNQVVAGSFGYTSGVLMLRPENYMIKNGTVY